MKASPIRRLAAVIVALTLPFALSCGDDNDGTTGPNGQGSALVGTWNATSFVAEGTDFVDTGITFTITLNDNGTYSLAVSGDTLGAFCDSGTSCSDSGSFESTSTTLTFDPGTVDEAAFDYSISGNTLTLDGEIEGTAVTATFQKVS